MTEEIEAKKAELLEIVDAKISALENEIQETESYLEELHKEIIYLQSLSNALS